MQKHQMNCRSCAGGGALKDQQTGQIYPCGACQGSGSVNRPEVGPQDYVFEYLIPAGQSQMQIPALTILSYDFLLKWMVAYTATPTDQFQIKDNTGYVWSNAPLQIQNGWGTGPLPFPVQPNLLLAKNTTITITITAAAGHSGELVFKGVSLADVPAAAPASS